MFRSFKNHRWVRAWTITSHRLCGCIYFSMMWMYLLNHDALIIIAWTIQCASDLLRKVTYAATLHIVMKTNLTGLGINLFPRRIQHISISDNINNDNATATLHMFLHWSYSCCVTFISKNIKQTAWNHKMSQHVIFILQLVDLYPEYPMKRFIMRSHEVSKPRDWSFKLVYHFEIWQASRQ